jgi:hypothetical protein
MGKSERVEGQESLQTAGGPTGYKYIHNHIFTIDVFLMLQHK